MTAGRNAYDVLHGDGGHDRLNRRIRAHANFAEYVPFILFLAALLEGGGARNVTIHALLLPLLIARIAHPVGMLAGINSTRRYILRAAPIMVTWLVLAIAALLLLLRLA